VTPHDAATKWQRQQQQILMQAYVKAWQTGAGNYRSSAAPPVAGQAARQPPEQPNGQMMQRAMQPALKSLASTVAGSLMVVPTTAQIAAAASASVALVDAMIVYLAAQAFRLAGGASVAWAGEQAGYAQAAAADGQLLRWQLDAGAKHCMDCPGLAGLPPMPLDQWPTLPGEGATDCGGGCKCSMQAAGVITPPVLTGHQLQTLQRVSAKAPQLVAV
jgi:hypothetical protein